MTKELPGSSFDSFSGGKARLSKAKQSEAQEKQSEAQERDQSTGVETSVPHVSTVSSERQSRILELLL